jgi:hypothetical protein
MTNGLHLGNCLNTEWLYRLNVPAVSFLEDEAAFNRTRRSPDAYAAVRQNIVEAVDRSLSPILFSTLTKETIRFARKIPEFADSLGIRVYFSRIQRAPRQDFDTLDYSSLKITDIDEAFNLLHRFRKEYECVRFDPDADAGWRRVQ